MITALIRTHAGREELIKRAVASCEREKCQYVIFHGDKVPDYTYNLYCNILKSKVKEGYFFFLDSDDFLIPGSLSIITPLLSPKSANVVQMLRNGLVKPRTKEFIKKGYIGMPCMVLHHSHKFVADVEATEDGDWLWIDKTIKSIGLNFIACPLVNAGKRGHGV